MRLIQQFTNKLHSIHALGSVPIYRVFTVQAVSHIKEASQI